MTQLYAFIYLLRYFLILYFATTATPSTAQYKIMVLGNSITQGNQDHPGYKYKLWQMLVDAQADVELVGSHDVNEGGSPAVKGTIYKGQTYTNRNEGHWGWSADEILNGRDGKGNLSEWLQGYTPDIVLMHLGTNDMFRQCASPSCYQETIKELKEVVRRIRLKNPNAILLVAKLIPAAIQTVGPEAARNIEMLNKMIPGMVRELNTPASPVTLVDQHEGFDPTIGIDTHDGVHPNASGELKMAEKWFAAIKSYMSILPVELTSFEAKATSFGAIQLTWRTASEKDNAYFEIQRATHLTDFRTLGQVKGVGTTQTAQTYHFEDAATTDGSLYYRLRQVDFDGSSSYSKVVHVERELKGDKLQVYPTSSDGGQQVTVQLQQLQPDAAVEVSIFASSGKLVKQFRKRVNSAGSLLEKVKVHDLEGAGLYFVRVFSEGQQLQREFLLME